LWCRFQKREAEKDYKHQFQKFQSHSTPHNDHSPEGTHHAIQMTAVHNGAAYNQQTATHIIHTTQDKLVKPRTMFDGDDLTDEEAIGILHSTGYDKSSQETIETDKDWNRMTTNDEMEIQRRRREHENKLQSEEQARLKRQKESESDIEFAKNVAKFAQKDSDIFQGEVLEKMENDEDPVFSTSAAPELSTTPNVTTRKDEDEKSDSEHDQNTPDVALHASSLKKKSAAIFEKLRVRNPSKSSRSRSRVESFSQNDFDKQYG